MSSLVLFVLGLLVLTWIVFIVVSGAFGTIQHIRFRKEYRRFLADNDGTEFLCYTSRGNSKQFVVTHVLPKLDPSVSVIFLEGRKPISQYEEHFITAMLNGINQVGFPNLMRIADGRVLDSSLHDDLYRAINGRSSIDDFLKALSQKLETLRRTSVDK